MTDKIELTDSEWMSIIDKDGDGLPACCANVSDLRDTLIDIAREGGDFKIYKERLKTHLTAVADGHELPPLIEKIRKMIED